MLLVLDPSGAPMLSVLVKRVDWLTVGLIVIQAHALIPMMLELHAMLLVSKKLIYHIIINIMTLAFNLLFLMHIL